MMKTLLAAAGIGLLAFAGWSVLWVAGRAQIETRLDDEIRAFAARGVEISHGSRQIGGFPFGYRVRHEAVEIRDPVQGVVYALPHVTTEVTAEEADRLVTTLPETFTIDLALPVGDDGGTEPLRMEVEAEDLMVVTIGAGGADQRIEVTAARLLAVSAGENQPLSFALDFTGTDYRGELPDPATGAPMTGALVMDLADYAYTVRTDTGALINVEGTISNPRVTVTSNLRDQDAVAGMFESPDALLEAAYQTGRVLYATRAVEGGPAGIFSGESGSAAGTVMIRDGRLEIAGSTRSNEIAFNAHPAADENGIQLGFDIRNIEGIYEVPLTPSDDLLPAGLRFALDEVVPDEAVWSLVDPSQAIERAPMNLIVDVQGSARLTKPLTEVRPGESPPVELGNMSINALDLDLPGATLTTRGDVDFIQPLWIPRGEVTVTATGLMNLIDGLVAAGVVAPQYKQMAAIVAGIYARPGESPDELISEIRMGPDGIYVNGQPVSAGQ